MPTPAPRGIARMYNDGRYATLHPEWHSERAGWKANHVVRAMRELGLEPESICDIGAGTGQILDHVVRSTPSLERAVGLEPSNDAPQPPLESDLVEMRRQDALTVEDRFDVALMLDVFEHVEDYLGFLRGCRRLAPVMIFHIPLEITVHAVVRNGLGVSRFRLGHLHQFTPRTAIDTLEYCEFSPVHQFFTPAAWDGPGRRPGTPINRARRVGSRVSEVWTQRLLGGMAMLVVAETGS